MPPASKPKKASRPALLSLGLLLALLLLVFGQSAGASAQSARPALSGDAQTLFRILNHERAKHGLRPLRRSAALDEAARWQSHDMVARAYFEHERPGGPSLARRIRRTGYLAGTGSWAIGENIAWGEGSLSTPESIMQAWMKSPGHRANILRRRFEHVGIGLEPGIPERAGQEGGVTATTDFGARD
jgi:uncharacterized protein YkwD